MVFDLLFSRSLQRRGCSRKISRGSEKLRVPCDPSVALGPEQSPEPKMTESWFGMAAVVHWRARTIFFYSRRGACERRGGSFSRCRTDLPPRVLKCLAPGASWGAGGSQTLRWREMDSNHRFPVAIGQVRTPEWRSLRRKYLHSLGRFR